MTPHSVRTLKRTATTVVTLHCRNRKMHGCLFSLVMRMASDQTKKKTEQSHQWTITKVAGAHMHTCQLARHVRDPFGEYPFDGGWKSLPVDVQDAALNYFRVFNDVQVSRTTLGLSALLSEFLTEKLREKFDEEFLFRSAARGVVVTPEQAADMVAKHMRKEWEKQKQTEVKSSASCGMMAVSSANEALQELSDSGWVVYKEYQGDKHERITRLFLMSPDTQKRVRDLSVLFFDPTFQVSTTHGLGHHMTCVTFSSFRKAHPIFYGFVTADDTDGAAWCWVLFLHHVHTSGGPVRARQDAPRVGTVEFDTIFTDNAPHFSTLFGTASEPGTIEVPESLKRTVSDFDKFQVPPGAHRLCVWHLMNSVVRYLYQRVPAGYKNRATFVDGIRGAMVRAKGAKTMACARKAIGDLTELLQSLEPTNWRDAVTRHLSKLLVDNAAMWCNAISLRFTAGAESTQVVESQQSRMKRFLPSDILELLKKLPEFDRRSFRVEDKQWDRWQRKELDERLRHVSKYALHHRLALVNSRISFPEECRIGNRGSVCHVFQMVWGFPCVHGFPTTPVLLDSDVDGCECFHKQWCAQPPPEPHDGDVFLPAPDPPTHRTGVRDTFTNTTNREPTAMQQRAASAYEAGRAALQKSVHALCEKGRRLLEFLANTPPVEEIPASRPRILAMTGMLKQSGKVSGFFQRSMTTLQKTYEQDATGGRRQARRRPGEGNRPTAQEKDLEQLSKVVEEMEQVQAHTEPRPLPQARSPPAKRRRLQ